MKNFTKSYNWKVNGYPKSFITHITQRSCGKCQEKINGGENERKLKARLWPYHLEEECEKISRGCYENIKRMLWKNHYQSGVVYRAPCKDCPLEYMYTVYNVGQSGCTLQCKIKEHKGLIEQGNTDTSAVAKHVYLEQWSQSGLGGCRSLG